MSGAVSYEDLSHAKMREPFIPFTIVMKDGRRLEITDRFQTGFNEKIVLVTDASMTHTCPFSIDQLDHLELTELGK